MTTPLTRKQKLPGNSCMYKDISFGCFQMKVFTYPLEGVGVFEILFRLQVQRPQKDINRF